ncbi:MAG: rubredoxin [Lachnospiraceae bacterium]
MKKYVCSICGYIYDEATGIPKANIAPNTRWDDIPSDWVCPLCGAAKSAFHEEDVVVVAEKPVTAMKPMGNIKELSALEMSALCSNLARGCEKQYKMEEAGLFTELATFFKSSVSPYSEPTSSQLLELIEKDLEEGFLTANAVSADAKDRGAMRALVWSEKVTRMQQSILARYEKEGNKMLENTGVYVCTICGFLYLGDTAPQICPVCKVPSWKFEKIEGRA